MNCRKINTRVIIFAFCIIWLFSGLTTIYAKSISELEKEKNQLAQEMKKTEQRIKAVKQQENGISKELKKISADVSKISQDINNMDEVINGVQASVKATQDLITAKEQDVDERSNVFEERLKDLYMKGEISYLEILVGSEGFSDFVARFEFLKRIAQNDMNILKVLETERSVLEENKLVLEKQKEDIQKIIIAKENSKKTLQIASSRQQETLLGTEAERKELEKILVDMEKSSEKLAQEILKIASKGNFTGTLVWPTPGYSRITSPFGSRIHPITRRNSFHSGVDIAAPMGAKVVSAANGRILLAGWQGAYGNTIVVDHGGLTTMYAHLSAFLVKAGDNVKQGQQIGKIGTTGWSTGPHLHFEVRINGQAANPLTYLNK